MSTMDDYNKLLVQISVINFNNKQIKKYMENNLLKICLAGNCPLEDFPMFC